MARAALSRFLISIDASESRPKKSASSPAMSWIVFRIRLRVNVLSEAGKPPSAVRTTSPAGPLALPPPIAVGQSTRPIVAHACFDLKKSTVARMPSKGVIRVNPMRESCAAIFVTEARESDSVPLRVVPESIPTAFQGP